MRACRASGLAAAVLLFSAGRASASVITFQFTAQVMTAAGTAQDRFGNLVGQEISGWYSFDSNEHDLNADRHVGNYGTTLPFQVDVAGEWMRWNGAAIDVYDDPSGPRFWQDAYFVAAYAGGRSSLADVNPGHFEFLMLGPAGPGPLTSDALLVCPLSFADLRPAGFELWYQDRDRSGVLGGVLTSLTAVTETAIPEPAALLLLGVGAWGWSLRRRARRR